ncbi:MAG: hypothetical protein Q9216_002908 [Gyalolechia sp. 2 TL-2023]
MAANIPAALKSADIARFAQRAGQVEKAKPSVAYWCNYWIVNQLISRGLHNVDDDCTRYTTELMDKLEKSKTEYKDDDTIMDDIAAQVFVEQFALETFQRAENAMRASKSSRQTADTLLAAAAFLELRQIWEPLDPETSSKVKFAKYHALRIAKAIKAGEDPNLTNPAQEPIPSPGLSVDPQGSDVHMSDGTPTQPAAYQPSVEEAPDGHGTSEGYRAHGLAADQSQPPSRAPLLSPRLDDAAPTPPEPVPENADVEKFYQHPSVPDVSPLQSPDRGRDGSISSGYFPRAPDLNHEQNLTANVRSDGLGFSSPPILPDPSSFPPQDSSSSTAPPNLPPANFPSYPPPGIAQNDSSTASVPTPMSGQQQPRLFQAATSRYPQPMAPSGIPQGHTAVTHEAAPASFSSAPQHSDASPVVVNEEALAKAQKHARWAISALNFEDVNTAVKELRGALESLGASEQETGEEESRDSGLEFRLRLRRELDCDQRCRPKSQTQSYYICSEGFIWYIKNFTRISPSIYPQEAKKEVETQLILTNPEVKVKTQPTQGEKEPHTLEGCLQTLGLTIAVEHLIMRKRFKVDLHKHVQNRNKQYLRRGSDRNKLDAMVSAFLGKHGERYFSHKDQQHPEELGSGKSTFWSQEAEPE